jgi:hypothetical protein
MAYLTPREREILVRTIMGEAAGEGPQGWAAVAHVIRNRTNDPRWPGDPSSVALEPQQFSAWNQGQGGNDMVRQGQDNPLFQQIGNVVDQVWGGAVPDPTQGATHYYAPAGMPGGQEPEWFDDVTRERGAGPVQIGGHLFSGRAQGQPRRPHSQTPGIAAPQYEADSPYYRAPGPDMASAIPTPRAKPEQGIDWKSVMGGSGGLLQALGGGGSGDEREQKQQAFLQESGDALDRIAQRRRAWNQSFDWL